MELKNQTKAVRAKKRAEKEKQQEAKKSQEEPSKETSANKKRGRKKSGVEDDMDEEERKAKKAKLEKVEGDRQFEGKAIPENQPLLLTGWFYRTDCASSTFYWRVTSCCHQVVS